MGGQKWDETKKKENKSIPGKLKQLQDHACTAVGIYAMPSNHCFLQHVANEERTSKNISAPLVLQNR